MRRGSWAVLFWVPPAAGLTVLTAWAGRSAWVFSDWWVPLVVYLLGVLLMAGDRRLAGGEERPQRRREPGPWVLIAYAAVLGVFEPVLVVSGWKERWVWFVPLAAPFVWAGVTGPRRKAWAYAVGA